MNSGGGENVFIEPNYYQLKVVEREIRPRFPSRLGKENGRQNLKERYDVAKGKKIVE